MTVETNLLEARLEAILDEVEMINAWIYEETIAREKLEADLTMARDDRYR